MSAAAALSFGGGGWDSVLEQRGVKRLWVDDGLGEAFVHDCATISDDIISAVRLYLLEVVPEDFGHGKTMFAKSALMDSWPKAPKALPATGKHYTSAIQALGLQEAGALPA